MEKETENTNDILVQNRLKSLKIRLEHLANAWTIDDYRSLLKFYVHILPKAIDAERVTIYIIEMGTDTICSIFGTGIKEKQIKPPRQGSVVGEVISNGKSIIKNHMDKEKGFHVVVDSETGFTTRSMICTPIKSLTGQGVTGAIQVLNKTDDGIFTSADLSLLEEISWHLSISIESIMLNQEILRISSQLNKEVERFNKSIYYDSIFIAESPVMNDVINLANLVSATPVNVLICGEHGTGKELIARMIHTSSSRRDRPFVAINCASIPEHLMESEFFGYEKGAFTGADRRRIGCFEEANGGTLLLDEISDMPITIQPKFLRAIQEGECRRLGGNQLIKFDVRIICTSNKDLKEEVKKGNFREDLFFRIFSVEIRIPPLRERKEDIISLSITFLKDTNKRFGRKVPGFSPEVLKLFENYSWIGNVRQLRREVERLVTLTPDGEQISINKCSEELKTYNNTVYINDINLQLPDQVKQLETRLIKSALLKTRGNRQTASKLLGITRQGLYKKIKRYNLSIG
ncbi:MAG: sigma-54-dependent Fis family transcriptional regulator [Desulfobacterales bacterium]|nr:sigma-54-dependent Fis family transcriptional regulator [Desulfobacterales bacterium]MBF0398753.1 sigma-54-dependent Fis family transcriptional regulator [Desulfobacterales bacterium]